jgi:hypothetical protein
MGARDNRTGAASMGSPTCRGDDRHAQARLRHAFHRVASVNVREARRAYVMVRTGRHRCASARTGAHEC